jgi:acyl-homoserine lactone acylase PvdQ
VIDDIELKRMGLWDDEANLYHIDRELLFYRKPDEPKKDKLSFKKLLWHPQRPYGDGVGIGSNCWAVGGQHTESGKPILACDPHLMKWMQSKWYLIKLSWGDKYFISGATTPGMPLFTYARTKDVSWGVTALNPDLSDLYVEKVDGDKYLYDDKWYEFKKISETFKVRGGSDVTIEYNHTHNGVIMLKPEEDKMDFAVWFPIEFLNQNENVYSLRWVYTEPQPTKIYEWMKTISEMDAPGGKETFEMLEH